MIPLWFTIETPLSPAQVFERINGITQPEPPSFWRQLKLDFASDPFNGKRFAGEVNSQAGTFRIYNYLWGFGEKTFTVYDGRVESLGAKTTVRVTLVLSSMLKIVLRIVALGFIIGYLTHPETRKNVPVIIFGVGIIALPMLVIIQGINCFKAKKLFLEILTATDTPSQLRKPR